MFIPLPQIYSTLLCTKLVVLAIAEVFLRKHCTYVFTGLAILPGLVTEGLVAAALRSHALGLLQRVAGRLSGNGGVPAVPALLVGVHQGVHTKSRTSK